MYIKEENFKSGEYKKYKYFIHRHEPLGHLCGYVKINSDHKYYSKDYFDMDIECHGGLTHGEFCLDLWMIEDRTEKYKQIEKYKDLIEKSTKSFYIGFDCNHLDDFSLYNDGEYRDMDYVLNEIKSIIDQLILIK